MTEALDTSRRAVRSFGLLFGGLAAGLTVYLLATDKGTWPWAALAALFFAITGLFAYPVLKPVYRAWMKFAFVLGWVNTRILLGAFFYLVLTPIGLVLRLAGKDLLDRRIDRSAPTYWTRRQSEPFDRSRYERLF